LVLQETRFGLASINGALHLTAAHGTAVVTAPLLVHSIIVENSLQMQEGAVEASEGAPPMNRQLNYWDSMCERFPLDDAISAMEARADPDRKARVVLLRMCCGAVLAAMPCLSLWL
jgi:hypothetical protein